MEYNFWKLWITILYTCELYNIVHQLCLCVCPRLLQLCSILCDPMDRSLPGSSIHGISQARILEWLPFPFAGGLPNLGIEPMSSVSPTLAGRFFTYWATKEVHLCVYSCDAAAAAAACISRILSPPQCEFIAYTLCPIHSGAKPWRIEW